MVRKDWWGRSASIDLHGCDPELLKDPKTIKIFVKELCQRINMKRVGPTMVKRFGHKNLRGYSMIQFIETSSIVGHFDENWNRAFIDVFSCKTFDPEITSKFSKKFFKAKKMVMHKLERV